MPIPSTAADAADAAWQTAMRLTDRDRPLAAALMHNAELAVMRELVARLLPGGLVEYWQMVDRELRS